MTPYDMIWMNCKIAHSPPWKKEAVLRVGWFLLPPNRSFQWCESFHFPHGPHQWYVSKLGTPTIRWCIITGWLFLATPLKNMSSSIGMTEKYTSESQLGWWHSQYFWENNPNGNQTTNQIMFPWMKMVRTYTGIHHLQPDPDMTPLEGSIGQASLP